MPAPNARLLPTRTRRLRFLAYSRRILIVMLPLGAGIGFLVALALRGLNAFEPWVLGLGATTHLSLFLPAAGLFLTTAWLHFTGIGEVSLFEDLDLAHRDPYAVFPFWKSLGKVVACTLTIGFGGSTGIEGPSKWFGAAIGLQLHRLLRKSSRTISQMRHFLDPVRVMVQGGAAAALSAVFRAPLSGALMAAEHHGRLSPTALIPCLVAAASGYVAFASMAGHAPLLYLGTPYVLRATEIFWALLLGLLCGLAAMLFLWIKARCRRWLDPIPLLWRGLVAGLGLTLLALPSHLLWSGFPITQGGGLELVRRLLEGGTLPSHAVLFLALKLAATALTLAGGGVGGLWLPSFAMGAALGAAFDSWLGLGQPGYMTLIGAATLTGATHRTLLIPVVFLAETTAQAALVVPALVGGTVSYLIAQERN